MTQTENAKVDFGRHRGTLWTRMPVSYLRWMVNTNHSRVEMAQAELDRRGIGDVPELDITGHAVDRASQRLLDLWQAEAETDKEGLHSWLMRRAKTAVELIGDDPPGEDGTRRVDHRGIRFCFKMDGEWPVLMTIMASKD